MLDGVTPFPAEFAARYAQRGYWAGLPLFDGFTSAFARYRDRVALVDGLSGPVTYRQLEQRSAHLARVLLDLGFGPLDRIIVQLPNTALFGYLYFALQRIGAAPVLALPGHRRREISQFAEISGARALAIPAAARGFDFTAMAAEVMAAHPDLELCLVQGAEGPLPDERFVRLEDLLDREPRASAADVGRVRIDPSDPALFLLSGGTTGIPKLIPRTAQRLPVQLQDRRRGLRDRRGRRAARRAADRAQPAARPAPACRAPCFSGGTWCWAPSVRPGTCSR